ncbi:MAG: sensory transduction histidine kinase [Ignavibacteriae bacterium]|nr:MAG: sensory transduction histidine kinase [Ignavibacteriota bacterium]
MEQSNELIQILENISAGFFALDKLYRFTYWNKAAEEGTGLNREEVLGKNVFDIFPNAKDAEIGIKYKLAMETGTFQSVVSSYKDDRFEKWYDIRIYPTESGISVFFQDITEQKQQERQKEMLLEISQVIISAQHVDDMCLEAASKIAKFLDVPEKFVCIYRFEPRTNLLHLMAPSFATINVPPDIEHQIVDEKNTTIAVRTAITCKPIVTDELSRSTLADFFFTEINSNQLKSLISIPLIVQGDLQGVLEVMSKRDSDYIGSELDLLKVIADELSIGLSRKRLMDEISIKNIELENEKAKTEEANEALKKFLAIFSHELRSPLNNIIGFSELLSTDFENLPRDKIKDFMKNIHTSGQHLQQLINDILDLSKIEAGKMELQIEGFPVNYFTESITRVLQKDIDQKKINLVYNISSEIDQLYVDQTRFKQILVNLISNAIKYSHPEGKVEVGIKRVENEIEIYVKDEGVGIKPEDLPKLFKPFQQTRSATMKEGTGLGLAITKRLVELHGGEIRVDSEPNKGTTFTIRIPMVLGIENALMSEENRKDLENLTEEIEDQTKRKEKPLVLIIEDNQQAIQLLEMYLNDAGYRTEVARDGVEGIEKAKKLKPDIITLDLLLPKKNGWQVMKDLKSHPICKNIPVIIISITDEKKLGFSLGAVDYFVKPVNKEELLATLKRIPLKKPTERSHPKIMVIDDDPTSVELIELILETEGYEVIKTYDGREGIDLILKEKPDLVILDLIMPEISGFNIAYQMRQNPETKNIPIIILTSMEIDDQTREKMESFVTTIMSKQKFTKKDLLKEINSIERMK